MHTDELDRTDADGESVTPPGDDLPRRSRRTRRNVVVGLLLAVVLLAAASLGVSRGRSTGEEITTSATGPVIAASEVARNPNPNPDTLDELIENLRLRVEAVPGDHVSWATLGIAYVQQAKATVDPSYYARADGALAESLDLDDEQNFLAYAGLSTLASARHEFALAEEYAERGLAINDFNPTLHGALSDARLQLGDYDAALAAAQRMNELEPATPALARLSYLYELRGETDLATRFMSDAADAAFLVGDRAFALFQLGELAFNEGDALGALDLYNEALAAVPDDPQALAGKARTLAVVDQENTAVSIYDELVRRAPEPAYVAAYGELLESLGRTEEAEQQYAVVEATRTLFAANGVEPDAEPILFEANHGDPASALAEAEVGIESRPFVAMYDAHAWALYRIGRFDEALVSIDEALATGYRNASFLYHSGMIKRALGDTDGAIADLSAALDLNPHFHPLAAVEAADVLASLRADS